MNFVGFCYKLHQKGSGGPLIFERDSVCALCPAFMWYFIHDNQLVEFQHKSCTGLKGTYFCLFCKYCYEACTEDKVV